MLASEFSFASDIVELLVLTGDTAFLQTLREAVGGARRLWHVPSGDKVSDLLVAGEVGILVLDVLALSEGAGVFIAQIKRQFPDLVIVVAGHRDAEIALAGLISAGTVHRFIHKPLSPGRAKSFADAAVKKYDEQRRRAGESSLINRASPARRGLLIGASIGMLGLIVATTWALHGNSSRDAGLPLVGGPQADALPEERLDEASVAIALARKSAEAQAQETKARAAAQPQAKVQASAQGSRGAVKAIAVTP